MRRIPFLQKRIKSVNKTLFIAVQKNLNFFEDTDELMALFNQFKSAGKIQGNFHDNSWFVISKRKAEINFALDNVIEEVHLALRFFTVVLISADNVCEIIQRKIRLLCKTIPLIVSNNYEDLEKFKEHYYSLPNISKSSIKTAVIGFIEFYSVPHSDHLRDFIENTARVLSKVRKLPDYNSILIFNELINFFYHCEMDKTILIKYYPVVIWWKLTSVIPMRPSEFCELKRDCFYKNSKEEYRLMIPRSKAEVKRSLDIPIEDDLKVSEELYKILSEYSALTQSANHSNNYFPTRIQESFNKTFQLPTFKYLLLRFYEEIIQGKYGYRIVKKGEVGQGHRHTLEIISPGDTRHFAFCNMMIQGFNELTIARLGGHSRLTSQIWYHSHLETYAQSSVYALADHFSFLREQNNCSAAIRDHISMIIKKSICTRGENSNYREVALGWCTDESFPDNCSDKDCVCDYLLIDIEKPGVKEKLSHLSNTLGINMNKCLSTLLDVRIKARPSEKDEETWKLYQEDLLGISRGLTNAIRRKANVDSFLNREARISENSGK